MGKGVLHLCLSLFTIGLLMSFIADAQPKDSVEPPGYLRRRFEWFELRRPGAPKDQQGFVRLQAWEQARLLPPYTATGFNPAQSGWEFIGPQGIERGWNGGVCAGQVTSIVLDPMDPSTVYAGGGSGGLWKSTSGGTSWLCISQNLPTGSSGAIAIDPSDRSTVYYGTGEYTLSDYSYNGAGIFRSRNGGESWEQLGREVLTGQRCASIQIHPHNRDTLWAGMSKGLYKSTDGGATWERTLRGMVQEVLIDTQDPSILYAAVGYPGGHRRNGFYKSTNSGNTWTLLRSLPNGIEVGRVEAGLCRDQPNVLYVSFTRVPTGLLGLYKTVDGGNSWTEIRGAPDYGGSQGWYNNVVAVSPADPNIVFLGGISMWRTTDGGEVWIDVGMTYLGGRLHPDIHSIAFNPFDPRIVYVGGDGGVYRSLNTGVGWSELNRSLGNVECYSLAIHPLNSEIVFGGTQDNGSMVKPGFSLYWETKFWGDGGYCAFKPTDPDTLFTEYLLLELYRSRDRGATWEPIFYGLPRLNPLFIAPFVLDPVTPGTIYAGSQVLSKSTNDGDQWSLISPDFGMPITAIAVAPTNPRTIYVGLLDGRVFKTVPGISEWGNFEWREITGSLPNHYVTSITIALSNPQLLYLTYGGFGRRHVFRSQDAGATWQNVTGNLPNISVNASLIHPDSHNALFVGTDIGVFFTPDVGTGTWYRFDQNLPAAVVVMQMAYRMPTRQVYMATHGRGMWRAIVPNLF